MKIKDYIFYRMYINYTKAKDDGIFSTIIFFTIIESCLFLPFITVAAFESLLIGRWRLIPIFIPITIIFILNCKRYYKKGRVVEIIRRYRNSKYNTIIKNWMIYSLTFLSLVVGMIVTVPVMKLYKYILTRGAFKQFGFLSC